jgi:WD40 repeat protein
MKDGTQLHRFDPKPHMHPITHKWTSVAFSGDERLVAAGREDGTIHVWDTATGQEVAMLLTQPKTVNSHSSFGEVKTISFSHDGSTIIGAGMDNNGGKRIYPDWVWSVATKQLVNTLNGHSNIVTASDLSKDGRFAVTGSWDRTAMIWDLRSGREHRLLDAHDKWVTAVAFSPDGNRVLTGSSDQTVRLWEVSSGRQVLNMDVGNAVNSVSYRAGEKYALVGTSMRPDTYLISSIDSNPVMIDLAKGTLAKLPRAFRKTPLESVNAAVSLDGGYVVFTATQRTRIRGRDVEASYLTLRELPE